jgi:hypothetical protein
MSAESSTPSSSTISSIENTQASTNSNHVETQLQSTTAATAPATAPVEISNSHSPNEAEAGETSLSTVTLDIDQMNNLLSSLLKQLSYYFSKQNLSKDTYLNTIMELNSGYVPLSIIANFANILKIVHSYFPIINDDNNDKDHQTPIIDIPDLLRQAALLSHHLEIVLLNQKGQVLVKFGHESFDQIQNSKITFMAVGPSSLPDDGLLHQTTTVNVNQSVSNHDDANASRQPNDNNNDHVSTPTHTTSTGGNKTSHVIILRDVHTDVSEDDIRSIFANIQSSSQRQISPTLVNVQREVGNCWFVTLCESTTQEDVISILLDLRNKKLQNEPIKARLKTQSMVSSAPTTTTTSNSNSSYPKKNMFGYNSSNNQSSTGYNHHKSRGNNNNNTNNTTTGTNQVYSGDRIAYSRKFQSSNDGGNKGPSTASSSSGGAGGSYMKYGAYQNKGNTTNVPANKKGFKDHEPKVVPPLVEEHFPTLGDNSPNRASSSIANNKTSTKDTVDNNATSKNSNNNDSEDLITMNQESNVKTLEKNSTTEKSKKEEAVAPTLTTTTPTVSVSTKPGGYAAALLKSTTILPTALPMPKETLTDKKIPKNGGSKAENDTSASSTKSAGTTHTEDSSSDDKSSLSSRPESEKSSNTVTSSPVSAWGGGRSFADIVKKQ